MRAWGALAAVVFAAGATGCTSVRVMQRDGCWVRQTEKFPKRVTEELGPCNRPEPKWAEDRISRVVQECMAQADYRWQSRALLAWNKGEPLPPQESDQQTMAECMKQAEVITENDALKNRLTELNAEREALRATVAQDRTYIRDSHDKVTAALGEAARKPAPAAVATATSNGTATTQSDLSAQPGYAMSVGPAGAGGLCSMPQPMKVSTPRTTCTPSAKPASNAASKPSASGAPACDPKAPAPSASDEQEAKVAAVVPPAAPSAVAPPADAGGVTGSSSPVPSAPAAK